MNRPSPSGLRLLVPVLGLLLATTLSPSATASPAASRTTTSAKEVGQTSQTSATAARATAWKCGKWKMTSASSGSRWCVRFSDIIPRVRQDGKDLLHNDFNRRQRMSCSLTRGTTIEFHASGTVEAEAGVIFAKAKSSVTAGGSRSTTTTSTTGAEFWVGAHKWAHCARGHAAFKLVGKTRRQVCAPAGCRYFAGGDFTGLMPSSPFFEIGPGRDINWQKFLPAE